MSVRAIRLDQLKVHVYSKDPDKGTEEEARWYIRPMPTRVVAHLRDSGTQYDSQVSTSKEGLEGEEGQSLNLASSFRVLANKVVIDTVRFGLAKVEKFFDGAGNEIGFEPVKQRVGGVEYLAVPDKILDSIPLEVMRELCEEINKLGEVTEEERKN